MARPILDRELTAPRRSTVGFDVATRADDAAIRLLLRRNPMAGRISITLEREPNYFADQPWPGTNKQTIVARDQGQVVSVGSCTLRPCHVNGTVCRVGYLGGLRLDAHYAGRSDILRRGYSFFRELQVERPAEFYFTSIATDNLRARRVLERGSPGMPRYEFVGEFVTVLVPVGRATGAGVLESGVGPFEEQLFHANKYNLGRQFGPHWSGEESSTITRLGLAPGSFAAASKEGRRVASAGIWDQRTYKQTVVRDYSPWLSRLRQVVNLGAWVVGEPRLPAIGLSIASAFVSHLAIETGAADSFVALIRHLRKLAARAGIQLLTFGFASADPLLGVLRRHFRRREYASRLYVVSWPGIGCRASELDGRPVSPEVALL